MNGEKPFGRMLVYIASIARRILADSTRRSLYHSQHPAVDVEGNAYLRLMKSRKIDFLAW